MRDQPPLTSDELAARAGLHERYVREWLGAMFTSGVVETVPGSDRYRLPPEHAAYPTRARRVGRQTHAVVGLRLRHLSNNDREGLGRNPDIEAIGG